MKKILLLNGPNLNFLGKRDPEHYGKLTLKDLEELTANEASKYQHETICFQSNHEGCLIDKIQQHAHECAGIIINPGAFTHYSYALHDALLDSRLPVVEVHLSKIDEREKWRSHSVTAPACIKAIWGRKEQGYIDAVKILMEHLQDGE